MSELFDVTGLINKYRELKDKNLEIELNNTLKGAKIEFLEEQINKIAKISKKIYENFYDKLDSSKLNDIEEILNICKNVESEEEHE